MTTSEMDLRRLVDAVVADDRDLVTQLLGDAPELAWASYSEGATRQSSGGENFIEAIRQVIYTGDTALHFAAAAYRTEMAEKLVAAGAKVRARNRRGCEPIHSAAVGSPEAGWWKPEAQAATIACLVRAGADVNARNMDGATALHRAVRTRSSAAVRTLLEAGADRGIRNKSGSTALDLARHTTGRPGSGSAGAKAELVAILELLG